MNDHIGTIVSYLGRKHSPRVVRTWLQEFGYVYDGLDRAVSERGERIDRELDNHAKRLAERAQMGADTPRIVGRSGVIR